jgi:mannose-6-phosphate isomerase-like protein (cupin superfamily)
MNQPQPVKDASSLYEVERRAEHAARPGFRITELQLSATQKVPWHTHSNVSDTFYVLDGQMRLFLQDPKEEVNLKPGEVYVVRPTRPASRDQRRYEVAHLPGSARRRRIRFCAAAGNEVIGFVAS